jgi:hypothetical protein
VLPGGGTEMAKGQDIVSSAEQASLQLKKEQAIPALTFSSEPINLAAMLFNRADKVISIA